MRFLIIADGLCALFAYRKDLLQISEEHDIPKISAARLLIYRAVVNGEQGFPSRLEAATAKVFSNEMGVEVTNAALQIFGGYGYSREYPLEWLVRFARGWSIAGGTAQIQRNNIARELLKGRDSRP